MACVCLCVQTVAELLTTDKLSELACVTLYMMYEKMNGKKSRWHHYIKELDRWDLDKSKAVILAE